MSDEANAPKEEFDMGFTTTWHRASCSALTKGKCNCTPAVSETQARLENERLAQLAADPPVSEAQARFGNELARLTAEADMARAESHAALLEQLLAEEWDGISDWPARMSAAIAQARRLAADIDARYPDKPSN